MTAVESPAAARWRVEICDRGRWVARCSPRADRAEAVEVLGRLQGHQPGEEFRVWPVGGAA